MSSDVLGFYEQPAVMTAAGRYAPLFEDLPADVSALTGVGHSAGGDLG